ncbi:hypothetical protein HZA33_03900 [Candidatus Pacearchaeota archaeon]|nr:hypothetical protein [Candidatus Pacearchaeota archaeon]
MPRYNLSNKGMEPLNKDELKSYKKLMQQLLNYPDSARCFTELHEASLKILREKGKERLSLFPKQDYNYSNSEEEIRFHLTYRKGILDDMLHIALFDAGKNISFTMGRVRGNLTRKREVKKDPVERIARGPTFIDLLKEYIQYQPCGLGYREDSLQRIIEY